VNGRGELPVWLEIQLGDVERAPAALTALEAVAGAAEDAGARLCVRIGRFETSPADTASRLRALADRGHEIGALARGRDLGTVVDRLRSAGLQIAVATPGLRHVSRGHREPLLRQVARLGLGVVVDRGEERSWAYEGLEARREQGLTVLAPTVLPRHWTRGRPVCGETVSALAVLERRASQQGARWFGVTLDSTSLIADGAPDATAVGALARWMDARVGGVAGRVADAAGAPQPGGATTDRRIRLEAAAADVLRAATRHWPDRLRRPGTAPVPAGRRLSLAVEGRDLAVERFGPATPRASIVCSLSGPVGARAEDLGFLGVGVADLVERDWAVWLYHRDPLSDRSRRPELGQAPHSDEQVADWQALLARTREDGCPVVALTWSAGVLVALRAAAAGHRPEALVDAEAPSDRWALFHPRGKGPRGLDRWDDEVWESLEAADLLPLLRRPYARLQAAHDHVHGAMTLHAERMVAAARSGGVAVREPRIGPGRLHQHPHEVLDALEWAVGHARSR